MQSALMQSVSAPGNRPLVIVLLGPTASGKTDLGIAIARALEVLFATGRPLSAQQGATPPPWSVVELGLNPANLKQRIAQRSATLFSTGLVEETRGLVERYGEACPLLDTIGYTEARAVLRGELNEAEAIALTTRRTQQFAKRQRTWFRRQHQPLWLESADPLQEALSAIEQVLG